MGKLERVPGKQNWVDHAGGLPKYIERIALHLRDEKGYETGRAIAVAVNACKRMCSSGDLNFKGTQNVNAKSRAEACAAIAEWNEKRMKARVGKGLKITLTDDEFTDIVAEFLGEDIDIEKHGHKGAPGYELLHPNGRGGKPNTPSGGGKNKRVGRNSSQDRKEESDFWKEQRSKLSESDLNSIGSSKKKEREMERRIANGASHRAMNLRTRSRVNEERAGNLGGWKRSGAGGNHTLGDTNGVHTIVTRWGDNEYVITTRRGNITLDKAKARTLAAAKSIGERYQERAVKNNRSIGKRDEIDHEFTIVSKNDEKQLVFGYASVGLDNEGNALIDKQGDVIDDPSEMERSAYNFVMHSRDGGEMHIRKGVSTLVESFVVTPEKLQAMSVVGDLPDDVIKSFPQAAWWVGFKVNDRDVWEKVKKREYPMFSVHGKGVRKAIEEGGE